MDQTHPLPISTSNLRPNPVNDSNGCVPMELEHFAGNSYEGTISSKKYVRKLC